MGFFDDLREMQKNATGKTAGAIAAIMSLPPAMATGLAAKIEGESFNDAADAVVEQWQERGEQIGRDHASTIASVLIAITSSEMNRRK